MNTDKVSKMSAFKVIAQGFPYKTKLGLTISDMDKFMDALHDEFVDAVKNKTFNYNLRAAQVIKILDNDYGLYAAKTFYDETMRIAGSTWSTDFYNYPGITVLMSKLHVSKNYDPKDELYD